MGFPLGKLCKTPGDVDGYKLCWLGDLTMAQSGKVSGCIGGFQGAEDYVLAEVKCLEESIREV